MRRVLSVAAVGTLIPALLLYLWNVTYIFTDLAIIWLLIVALLIFLGNRFLVLERWRAERHIVLRPDSSVSRWMTGQLWSVISSILLVAILVPALAWHALTMPVGVASILFALAFAAAVLFLAVRSFLNRHLLPPFDRIFASGPSAWLIGVPFALILFYVTWHAPDIPEDVLSASLMEALSIGMRDLPHRRGWISEALSFGYMFEGAKLWFVGQLRDYPFVAAIFNLDMVLFGLLTARASIVMTNFIETHYDGKSA